MEARLAHEFEGASVEACHDGVTRAAGGGNVMSIDCCGLTTAHRCDMANCMRHTHLFSSCLSMSLGLHSHMEAEVDRVQVPGHVI